MEEDKKKELKVKNKETTIYINGKKFMTLDKCENIIILPRESKKILYELV